MAYDLRNDTVIFSQTEDKTITNTTAETSAMGAGIGSRMIEANMLKPGKRILITGEGLYSIPLALTTNMVIRVKIGGVTVATATTTSLLLGASNKAFSVNIRVVCREIGAAGKVVVGGTANYTNTSGQKMWDDLDNAGQVSTIDTTVDNMMDVTVQWNAASTSRSLTTKIATIMVV